MCLVQSRNAVATDCGVQILFVARFFALVLSTSQRACQRSVSSISCAYLKRRSTCFVRNTRGQHTGRSRRNIDANSNAVDRRKQARRRTENLRWSYTHSTEGRSIVVQFNRTNRRPSIVAQVSGTGFNSKLFCLRFLLWRFKKRARTIRAIRAIGAIKSIRNQ